MSDRLSSLTHRDAPWAGLRVLVTGLGVSGFAAVGAGGYENTNSGSYATVPGGRANNAAASVL